MNQLTNIFKIKGKVQVIVFTILLAFTTGGVAYADDFSGPESSIGPIFNSILRILNVLVYFSGAVFLIMVFISAYKYALAQGDPKGLQGAKDTLTLAIVGFIVVVGGFTLVKILLAAFGLNPDLLNPVASLQTAIQAFIEKLNACNTGTTLGCAN